MTDAQRNSSLAHPFAACLSTITPHGAPNARIVDVKEANERGFVVCTHLESRKATEILRTPRVALTFWWDNLGRQLRVLGDAEPLSDAEADLQFSTRPRDAQITSWASIPGARIANLDEVLASRRAAIGRFDDNPVPRPADWGAFRIVPHLIEFFTFRDDRLHLREVFERTAGGWTSYLLAP